MPSRGTRKTVTGMNRRRVANRWSMWTCGALLVPAIAHAQAAEPPPPAAPTAAPPPAPDPAAPPPAVAPPPTSGEAMPATRPDKLPPIDVGAWVRVGARIQGRDPKKLDDQSMDTAYGELHAGGKVH